MVSCASRLSMAANHTVSASLSVGVTGHRSDRPGRGTPDVEAARRALASVLAAVRQAARASRGPVAAGDESDPSCVPAAGGCGLHLISALAPGADQWAAAEALDLGYLLRVVLPLDRTTSREDASGGDAERAAEFDRLLRCAVSVTELGGTRTRTPDGLLRPDRVAYLLAGRAVLQRSDLLLALWDGQPARGTGGTGQIVEEALGEGVPVVWLPWMAPLSWRVLDPARPGGFAAAPGPRDASALAQMVKQRLPPALRYATLEESEGQA